MILHENGLKLVLIEKKEPRELFPDKNKLKGLKIDCKRSDQSLNIDENYKNSHENEISKPMKYKMVVKAIRI